MSTESGPKRSLDKKQISAVDRALDQILSKRASVPEVLSSRRAELEKALSFGYTHKELANIISQTANVVITSADIKNALRPDDDRTGEQNAELGAPPDAAQNDGSLAAPEAPRMPRKAPPRRKPSKTAAPPEDAETASAPD